VGNRASGSLVTLGAVAAVVATAVTGTPSSLPDVALGSPALFHLERAVAFLAGYLALVMAVARAWSGELPSSVSTQGLTYPAEDVKGATSRALKGLSGELKALRERVKRIENRE
jgi:hypothetical protein